MTPLRRLAIASATAALLGGLASPTLAADTVTVDATVTIDAPCLTVSTESIDFGRLRFTGDLYPSISSRAVSYASCSETQELVFARGTNATEAGGGAASWQLGDLPNGCPDDGPNIFILDLRNSTDFRVGGARLGLTDQQIDTIAGGATGQLDEVNFWAPCEGSDGAGSTMTFQIIFTATF